jgi:hypothetical protein
MHLADLKCDSLRVLVSLDWNFNEVTLGKFNFDYQNLFFLDALR